MLVLQLIISEFYADLSGQNVSDPFILQGILNKLTPQRFNELAEQALALKIDSHNKLRGCIEIIFKNVRLLFLSVSFDLSLSLLSYK